jgi:hypothetical protein
VHVEYATFGRARLRYVAPDGKRMKGVNSQPGGDRGGGLIYGAVVFAPGARSGLVCPAEAG